MSEQQQGIDLAALLIRTAAEYGGDLNGALYDLQLGRKTREAGMAETVIAAAEPAHPCWSCSKPVTMGRRAAADGNCPHCGAELDLDDWPPAQQQAEPDAIVPKEMEVPDCTGSDLGNNFEIGYATGWNECREAMLAAAQKGGAA